MYVEEFIPCSGEMQLPRNVDATVDRAPAIILHSFTSMRSVQVLAGTDDHS